MPGRQCVAGVLTGAPSRGRDGSTVSDAAQLGEPPRKDCRQVAHRRACRRSDSTLLRVSSSGGSPASGKAQRQADPAAALTRMLALDPGWGQIEPRLRVERFSPPRVRDFGAELGAPEAKLRDLLKRLGRMGKLVEVAHDHFFLRDVVAEMIGRVVRVAAAAEGNAFSAAQFRDEIAIGRKVAIQILEFYDRHGITVRREDLRKVHPGRLNMFGSVPPSAQPPDAAGGGNG
jgi:selenocysteine-specific elongation factor